ncbi:MAG: hemerythrin domain-containing protein [Phycisphaerales bacterium]|nr:hemerythrin domain-containing protein [Phycisphaerales bacterium]
MTKATISRSGKSSVSMQWARIAARPLMGLSVLLAAAGCAATAPGSGPGSASAHNQPDSAARPTDAFRAHHAEIIEHLGHIDAMAVALRGQSPEEQRRTMQRAVTFLKEHIAAHAADEERVLYPVVQRESGPGSRLTAVPIYEHRIVERLIAALDKEASQRTPDAAAFALTAHHLTGLLLGHFEIEEQVLLPVLDQTMTAEQFQREVADKMPH